MKNMKYAVIVLWTISLVLIGCTQQSSETNTYLTGASSQNPIAEGGPSDAPMTAQASSASAEKEFYVEASRFKFEPNTIAVTQGDKVKIRAKSIDVPHGFAIDEYGINLYLTPGEEKTTTFVANKAGTFTFYCNLPCGVGHSAMKGKLIVQEN